MWQDLCPEPPAAAWRTVTPRAVARGALFPRQRCSGCVSVTCSIEVGPEWSQEVSSGSACPLLGGRWLLPCPCRAGAVTERRSLARTERLGDGFKHEIITKQKSHIKAFNFTPGTLLSLSEILIEDRQMSLPIPDLHLLLREHPSQRRYGAKAVLGFAAAKPTLRFKSPADLGEAFQC